MAIVTDLEKELLSCETRNDRSRLESLLADDFNEVGASGTLYDRASVIELLLNEKISIVYSDNFRETPLSKDVILVTYRTSRCGDFNTGVHRSSIWKNFRDAWRLVYHQGTTY